MYKRITYFTAILLILFLMACEKEIGYNHKNQSTFLVMNSYLSPDSVFSVSVTQSFSIMENWGGVIVTDAEAKVYENETFLETLKYDTVRWRYYGTRKPSVGRSYKITVARKDFLPIEATSVIEPAPEIFKGNIVKDSITGITSATITFKDPPGVKNFYRLVVANVDEFDEKPDWYGNGDYGSGSHYILETGNGGWSGPGWIYTNYFVHITSNDPNLNASSAIDFLDDVPDNIFNIFNDDLIDGKEYSLTFSFYPSYYPDAKNETVIYLQAITEGLHKYFKTYAAQYYYGNEDLLMEPIQVYTNVKNGAGILGSFNSKKFIVNMDNIVTKPYGS